MIHGIEAPLRSSAARPLSAAERRAWLAHEQDGELPSHAVAAAWRMRGAPPAAGWHEVVRRACAELAPWPHRFHEVHGELVAEEVGPAEGFSWREVDLASAAGAARLEDAVNRFAAIESHRRFDLGRGPLARFLLLRHGPDDHVLLLVAHRIVIDPPGERWLGRALARQLGCGPGAEPAPLPLAEPRADGENMEERLVAALRGAPTSLNLLPDFVRPRRPSGNGRRERFTIDRGLGASVAAFAAALRVEPSAVWFAGWWATLARMTGQRDIVIGLPLDTRAGDPHPARAGFSLNLVPLRLAGADPTAFETLVTGAAATMDLAARGRHVPFERLVERINPRRDPGRGPLFDTLFVPPWFEEPLSETGATVALSSWPVDPAVASFDLTLQLEPDAGGGMTGYLEHRSDLFSADSARRMVARWLHLVGAAVARPETPLRELPVLAPGEYAEVVMEFNRTDRVFDPSLRLHDFLERHARARPDAVALEFGAVRVSYGELLQRAGRLAARLRRAGVKRGETVAVFMHRSESLPEALFGILAAGGAYVPIDPSLPDERVRFLLEDCGAGVAVVGHGLDLPEGSRPSVCRPGPDQGSEGEDDASSEREDAVHPRDLAYVIYTSGSTGKPKGSLIEHRSIVNRLLWMQEKYPFREDDVQLQTTTISFDVSVVELFMWSVAGARLALPPPGAEKDPAVLVEAIRRHRVTRLHFVPSMLGAFLAHVRAAGSVAELGTLRQVYCSGEALPGAMVREFEELIGRPCGATLHNLYGPTEAAVEVTWFDCADFRHQTSVPIGRPVANTQIYVLDEDRRPVPVGCPGELHIAGVQVARGYLKRPELTDERFVPVPFSREPGARMYRTGDLARWLADGTVEYLGRTDFQIKVRGVRVEPGEIEAALLEEPAVGSAVVVACDDRRGEKLMVGYVTPAGDRARPEPPALLASLRQRLPAQLVPAVIVVLDRLPLGVTGKVDRRALPRPSFPAGGGTALAPGDGAGRRLAALWRDELGLEGDEAPGLFFEQGGHSLLAVRLLARIRGETGAVVTLAEFLRDASFEMLLARVRQHGRGGAEASPGPLRAARGSALPVSIVQRQLWFLHQLDPAGSGHNIVFVLELRGPLDRAALERALDGLVRRHEALRTVFPAASDGPAQVILESGGARLPRLTLEEAGGEAAWQRVLREEDHRSFNLEHGPLFIARLVALAPDLHRLVLNLHHIIADESAEEMLFRDLALAYRAEREGRAPGWTELALQPADVAVWEQSPEQARERGHLLDWWRTELAGAAPVLPLPTDEPRPAQLKFSGSRAFATLPKDVSEVFDRAVRASGASAFVGFLAAWSSFLARLCDRDEVVVGSPVSLRTDELATEAVGCFINPLPFRVRQARAGSFREMLGRARAVALDVFAHARAPLAGLVEHLRPERPEGTTPIFQAMLVMRGPAAPAPEMDGLATRLIDHHPVSAKVDLTLLVAEREGRYEFALEYRDDLFQRSTVEGWLADFGDYLEHLAAAADSPAASLACVSARERARQLEWAVSARVDAPEDATLCRLVLAQAAGKGEMAAVEGPLAAPLSYADLEKASASWASVVRGYTHTAGPKVGICCTRSPGMIVALLAAMRAGAAYVPLDPAWPESRIRTVVDDAGIEVVLAGNGDAAAVMASVAAARPRLAVLRLDCEGPDSGRSPGSIDGSMAQPSDPAYLIYTSGSTGRPKGVVVEHRQIVASTLARGPVYGRPPGRFLLLSPVVFDSSVAGIFWTLGTGGTLVLPPPGMERDVAAIADLIVSARINTLLSLPSLHALLLEELRGRATGLETVIVAGEACPVFLPAAHRAALPGVRLFNEYGPTEASVWAVAADITDECGSATVPIGRPIPGARVYLTDASLRLVPRGATGEIVLAGPGLARGYHGAPEATAARFKDGPFAELPESRLYRTGDAGRWLSDGRLAFAGRLDEQIKLRGFRIEPGEIESVLCEHPGVREAAVQAVDLEKRGRTLVAWVGRSGPPGEDPTGELRAFLRGRLPEHMVPAFFVFLDALPRNANGKVDRQALPAFEIEEAGRRRAALAPRTTMEALLARVWGDVLGMSGPVGVRDDFFELGGHSLLAVRLAHETGRATGRPVPLSMVLAARTVEELGTRLQQGNAGGAAARPSDRRGRGAGATLFNIPGFGGVGVMHQALARAVEADRRYFDGLVLPGVDGRGVPLESTEAIAAALIEQIRAVQPRGPYTLTGFCLGGLYAYEVAQQLTAAGEEVRGIALWHAFPPDAAKERSWFGRVGAVARRVSRGGPEPRLVFLRTYGTHLVRGLRARAGRLARLVLRRPPPRVVDSPWNAAQTRAGASYQMKPYAGPLLVVRATQLSLSESLAQELTPQWGWERLAAGPFTIDDFACGHMDLLHEPFLSEVAGRTAAWLRARDEAAVRML